MARNTITDEAARKRQEIGLSARRETARSAVNRPPTNWEEQSAIAGEIGASDVGGFGHWWLVLFLSLLILATFLLVAARFLQSPTDLPTVDTEVTQITKGKVSLQGVEGLWERVRQRTSGTTVRNQTPRLFDDFNANTSLLPVSSNATRSQQSEPEFGIYRMRVEPGSAAWSLLGDSSLMNFRLETSSRIVFDHPQSSAGLIVRFVDENHFYLFAVDGEGRFQVLHANGAGNWLQLLPWTESNAINAAGVNNVMEIEDWNNLIRFSVNGTPIFEHEIEPGTLNSPGDAGLWTSATAKDLAEVEFDYLRLEPLEN